MNLSQTIHDMPPDDRPRERLIREGASVLSNAELLAILLRVGVRGRSAIQVAQQILNHWSDLRRLASASTADLCAIDGIKEAKAAQIAAAIELGRRIERATAQERINVSDPESVYRFLAPRLRDETREVIQVLSLDVRNGIINEETIAIGAPDRCPVSMREVFHPAIKHRAVSIILAHNHPSGDPSPSSQDIALTRLVAEAGRMLSITLLDHIIVGANRFYSMAQHGHVSDGNPARII